MKKCSCVCVCIHTYIRNNYKILIEEIKDLHIFLSMARTLNLISMSKSRFKVISLIPIKVTLVIFHHILNPVQALSLACHPEVLEPHWFGFHLPLQHPGHPSASPLSPSSDSLASLSPRPCHHYLNWKEQCLTPDRYLKYVSWVELKNYHLNESDFTIYYCSGGI